MKYILAIGNPGIEYSKQYHSLGLIFADWLIERWQGQETSSKSNYKVFKLVEPESGITCNLIKSQVFMNHSARAITPLQQLYKFDGSDLLVMHDELNCKLFQLRLKYMQGHGGHNGLRDLNAHVSGDYARLQIGIDHPKNFNPHLSVHDYVLSKVQDLEGYKKAFNEVGVGLIQKWLAQ